MINLNEFLMKLSNHLDIFVKNIKNEKEIELRKNFNTIYNDVLRGKNLDAIDNGNIISDFSILLSKPKEAVLH